ncbi:hypothetical protein E5676_scaffold477G00500 [Cucumis melo var. makuwa]|uniref:DUF659 domain-containing protein n=1 Tax=Cucumis melo var. makuwa TaxID=1194695 RepID=A0A5D3CVC7_CUCMM|nr:hypothetical protein E6C27_scaffold795G00550 [Cucumis melo var. makuwa]TYK15475.1 hypothetical protein E5676_scaffold477G00500 [Cucumis melo var. makuwa]
MAGRLLEAKRPQLIWSPCAAHCLDLMLEDIYKISNICKALKRGMEISNFIYLYNKKRNSLAQNHLNGLVFIKYNRALKSRYNLRDIVDPISLRDIDDSNEWLIGRLDDDSEEEDELVFDNGTLTKVMFQELPEQKNQPSILELGPQDQRLMFHVHPRLPHNPYPNK